MKANKPIFVGLGFGLLFLGNRIGRYGDRAPLNAGGVSPERASYHLIAAVVSFAAICFFVAALVSMLRSRSG